ncbi:Asparagine synthetase [glutamine-hydrolyzing] 1 [Planctomycetes bacterium Pan216]|uniref:asparagine synthase (glutamine-hydrolyzing) n=1 Tax=Kolteria novifilia TaxID=2527975 RepID=A0A518AX31_9BACT|nr:Asparagine synthetase [glutamine-hydrolyzing] 1 [Planctomycetes bacterium Pan216]
MCGICGIVWSDPERRTPEGLIERMTYRLHHRGPDGQGIHATPGVALGHRRLAVIDPNHGRQPISNEDETIWVTFNGEIYNFAPIRHQLERLGHVFRTKTDTEVLVHLYEQHGPEMVHHLRGMFAFAIWDSRARKLFLARDRLGQKPLVYWQDDQGIRFASEIKSLAAEEGFPKQLDPLALDDFLTLQYVPAPKTIFRNVFKLPPAHTATFENGELRLQRYWTPPYQEEVRHSEAEWIEELQTTLAEATKLRLIADVPLGAFLSGGIDSTIVVGLMRQFSDSPVKTFSIGFRQRDYDETPFAREASDFHRTDHEEFFVNPDAAEIVEKLTHFHDEPFGDSSAIPTWYVSRLSRRHVTVALTGDAGDELFGGYPRYQAVRLGEWFDRMPGILRDAATWSGWQRLPGSNDQKSKTRRFKRLVESLGKEPKQRYVEWISILNRSARDALYDPEFQQQLNGYRAESRIFDLYDELPGRDFVTRTGYVDLLSYLPGDLLAKVDIASMACGLECRSPFLDQEVVALAGRMPASMKLRGLKTKHLLKQAFGHLIPTRLLKRPKMGFGVPIHAWFRNDLADMTCDLLLGQEARQRGWFRPEYINGLIEEHLSKRWDHGYRLWSLLMLELWARRYLDATD